MKKYNSYITPHTQAYSFIELDAPICWTLPPASGKPSSPGGKVVVKEPTYK